MNKLCHRVSFLPRDAILLLLYHVILGNWGERLVGRWRCQNTSGVTHTNCMVYMIKRVRYICSLRLIYLLILVHTHLATFIQVSRLVHRLVHREVDSRNYIAIGLLVSCILFSSTVCLLSRCLFVCCCRPSASCRPSFSRHKAQGMLSAPTKLM